jgi:hypothetical protein
MGQAAAASSFLNVATHDKGISSDIKELDQNSKIREMVVYPNPAHETDEVKILFPDVLESKCIIRIYNQSGQLVRLIQKNILSGSQQVELKTGLKSPGIYMLQVISGSNSYQSKLLIY